jgi:hypothetical protein
MLEVLDRVGDEGLGARDAGALQPRVEHPAGGADERRAGQVLLIAWLLADQHQRRLGRPFAGHALGGAAPQVAAPAEADPRPHLLQRARRALVPGPVAAGPEGGASGAGRDRGRVRVRQGAIPSAADRGMAAVGERFRYVLFLF